MARQNWGGGGDFSGIFAGLQMQFENRLASATAEELRRAREEQNAKDKDTYDQWKNGIISDEEWLQYINEREIATRGGTDPAEHEQWLELQREHTTAISDAQTESAFEAGDISINAIIAYYKTRLDGVDPSSPAYRALNTRYFALIDEQLSDEIYAGAERIIDGIERGTASYQQLLSYYNSVLGRTRANSDLRRQVSREIDQVQDLVDQVGRQAGGGGGGGGGGGSGSGMSSDQIAAINDIIVARARGYSPYDAAGPDVLQSIATLLGNPTVDDLRDAYMADLNRIKAINEQWKNNPSAEFFVDPLTGIRYPNDMEFLRTLDNQFLRTEETLFAIDWTNGDTDDATADLLFRQQYITQYMQPHNTENVRPVWDEMQQGTFAGIVAGSTISDPFQREQYYEDLAETAIEMGENIMKDRRRVSSQITMTEDDTDRKPNYATRDKPIEELPDEQMQVEIEWFQDFMSVVGDTTMTPDQKQTKFNALLGSRPEGFWLSEAELVNYINGAEDGSTGLGIMETSAARYGIQGLHQGPNGEPVKWGFFDDGSGVVRAMPDSQIVEAQSRLGAEGVPLVVTMERIGGVVRPVYRPAQPPTGQGWFVWKDPDGNIVSSAIVESLSPDDLAAGYTREVFRGGGWFSMRTSDGHIWYQDPVTRLWYKDRMPIKIRTDSTGAIIVDANGQITSGWQILPFASSMGVVAPYIGISPKDAQSGIEAAVDAGLIDLSSYYTRDRNGNSTNQHPTVSGMYYDPSDAGALSDVDMTFAQKKSLRESNEKAWQMRQEQKRRAEVQADINSYVDRKYTASEQFKFQKLGGETLEQSLWDKFSQAALETGISFGDFIQPKPPTFTQAREGGAAAISSSLAKTAPIPIAPHWDKGETLAPLPTVASGPKIAPALPPPPAPKPAPLPPKISPVYNTTKESISDRYTPQPAPAPAPPPPTKIGGHTPY